MRPTVRMAPAADAIPRRTFLQAGLACGVGASVAAGAVEAEPVVPRGVELERLREAIEDRPAELVARAARLGWRVVADPTVLSRLPAWQAELAVALAEHRIELAAVEAVVDFGRVTFASANPRVRQAVRRRLEAAIRQARTLRCRHLLVVPGLAARGVPAEVARQRIEELLSECRHRARRAGLCLVVEAIDRGPDHPRMAVVH